MWIDIVGHEDYYQINEYGDIRSKLTNKTIIGDYNSVGYRRVTLYQPFRKRYFVHRLVAEHFCDGYQDNMVVNHKDGNKQNNRADNLEWVTRSKNDLHAYKMKLRQIYPCQFKHAVIARDSETNSFYKRYSNVQECCDDLHVTRPSVYNCCNHKTATCRGYYLSYE